MKKLNLLLVTLLFLGTAAQAQIVQKLGNAIKNKESNILNTEAAKLTKSAARATTGKTYYVSAATGSARAEGTTPETPLKDLQKAIDAAEDNDVILVAEGNYLGTMNCGFIENGKFGNASSLGKFISIIGGYSTDFKERDVLKHITKIQPTDQAFISPLLTFKCRRPYGYNGPEGEVLIDGLVFELGENNLYFQPNVNDDVTGTPNNGVLSGRFIEPGASTSMPTMGYSCGDEYALAIDVEGNVTIRNCTFINCRDYGIQGSMGKGHLNIYNNVFVACRYAACQVQGSVRDEDIDKVSLSFYNNTVLFTWTRTKTFEDMGYGFRFMNKIRTIDVHHNIFGCCSRAALDRTRYESNKSMEAAKESNLYDNYFFSNRTDLELARNGMEVKVAAANIEEANEIGPKYENNCEMPENEEFLKAIDASYLQGYMNIKVIASSSYNANSAANQWNRTIGTNQQGSETVRPNMYCNKYPWMKAFDLYGAVKGYGAQKPE